VGNNTKLLKNKNVFSREGIQAGQNSPGISNGPLNGDHNLDLLTLWLNKPFDMQNRQDGPVKFKGFNFLTISLEFRVWVILWAISDTHLMEIPGRPDTAAAC